VSAARRADVTVILVEGVSKVFQVPTERRTRLKDHVINLFRSPGRRRFEALKDIDFTVGRGEFFSIIGHNGSGKSTLMKILAGIYQPTRGRVKITGQLSPFIELGVGFNPELTARDNIFLNGAILGLDRGQVTAVFDDILRFSELEDFVDQKLKNFSSGMLVRLAFSIAIRAHAEILLIDEVLAVGDANFQQKCFDVFLRMKADGRTIVFVSHDLGAVRQFSDRVMVLNHGVSHGIFNPSEAIAIHNRLSEEHSNRELERAAAEEAQEPQVDEVDERRPSLHGVQMLVRGHSTHVVHRGDDVTIRVAVHNPERVPVNIGVAVSRTDGLYCFGTNTFLADVRPSSHLWIQADLKLTQLPLQRGTYFLTVGVFGETDSSIYQMKGQAFDFQVRQADDDGYQGLVYLTHDWALRRGSGASGDAANDLADAAG
jgi:ABC-type polysaccharide/polyol phosphate transport system ATPase subunit